MKRNFLSLFVVVSFLVVGDLQSTPTPTPTPKPGLKIKSMVVTTPTPAPPPKRIKGTVAGPTSTPIRIDKGTKTGPGPTPTKIGKDQIKAAPSRAPIKVIKTQVSTPTPTVAPIKVIKTQISTPTPTPSRKIKDQVTSSTTPIKIPKDGVTGGGGRPGPINLSGPTPGSKKLTPGQTNLPPNPARNVGSNDSAPAAPPSPKRLIPGPNNLPPNPAKNLGADNSVLPQPPPPNTGIGNQNPNPIVNGETRLGGNTGTAQGTAPTPKKPIDHELRIYTMNGHGTSSTNLGGDIQSAKLDVYANVDKEFTLRWARPTVGGEEKGNLYVVPKNSGGSFWIGVQSVTMPAGSITVNIPYTLPHPEPNTYELNIVGDNGNSNNVTVNYTGEGSDESSAIKLPPPQEVPADLAIGAWMLTSEGWWGNAVVVKNIGIGSSPECAITVTYAYQYVAPYSGYILPQQPDYFKPGKSTETLWAVPAIKPGESALVVINRRTDMNFKPLKATVDPNNKVKEFNKNNNTWSEDASPIELLPHSKPESQSLP